MKWFGSKAETSPGGSTIERHPAKGFMKPQLGFADESTAGFTETREEVYTRMFGKAESVSHEMVPQIPHIDVYTFFRRGEDGSATCALVTGGMSDVPMRIPRGADVPRRVELILYCTEPKPEYIATMRWLAHFPHNQKTWIGEGHTIPNGNPPAPFWGSEVLDTILLMPTIVTRDRSLPDELKLGGDPVSFLWIVPLSTPECNLKLEKGINAIYELFGQHKHPYVFDPERKSYV